ncbi:siderophore-interacting protein [Sneathiella sp.]|uniref:siderophore-interacting protein n=1 Tax=Sneathiella sp. TaxID=1964365 RepID=UPI0026277221|nr:siderophore-interacting protein [Sneathiella sp.]MDF2368038.1 siderophore-interacting protein [Sneathiella sp.]
MTSGEPTAASASKPNFPIPRKITVKEVTVLSPRMRRVTFISDQFDGFEPPLPGAHIKLFFVPGDFDWSLMDNSPVRPLPPSRTYTPRNVRPEIGEIDIDFMLHGEGIASGWARQATPGQHLVLAGPRGGYVPPETADRLIIVADDTAIPAASMVLEAAGETRIAEMILEVDTLEEERPLSPHVPFSPIWLHRAEGIGKAFGERLVEEVRRAAREYPDAYWWVACESGIMRRIRHSLAQEFDVPADRLLTRGYWKQQAENYPDNDYGDDSASKAGHSHTH